MQQQTFFLEIREISQRKPETAEFNVLQGS